MCQRLPGPRCANHTSQAIIAIEEEIVEAKKHRRPTIALDTKLASTKFEYYGTPTGQKELKAILGSIPTNSVDQKGLQEFTESTKAAYEAKRSALQSVIDKEKEAKRIEARRQKMIDDLAQQQAVLAQEIEDLKSGKTHVPDVTTRYKPSTSSMSYSGKGGKW